MCLPLLIGAAAMGIGSAIAGGVGSANAAAAQKDSAEKALQFQKEMAAQQQKNMQPWLQGGQQSLAQLLQQQQAGAFDKQVDPSQIANDPGYQFRMAQGQQALERSASARGMLNSGGAMKSLARYSQGVASDEYQNAWNRNQADNTGRFNRLSSLAGVGQTAAQNLGAMGAQNSAQMSNILGAIGNANAAGAMGTANAVSGGFQSMGNLMTLGAMYPGLGGGGGGTIPTQFGYTGGPAYGQSTMGYQSQGFGPWK